MRYTFEVWLTADGDTPEEAWELACEGFSYEPGDVSTAVIVSVEDDEDEEW